MPPTINLTQTDLRHSALITPITRVLQAALDAVDPIQAVRNAVQRMDDDLFIGGERFALADYPRIWITGAGKASLGMAAALNDLLPDRLTGGAIVTKNMPPGMGTRLGKISVYAGDHPVPGERSRLGTQAVLASMQGLKADDLIFCVISGGASALLTEPALGVSLADLQQLTKDLLACGASIYEINTLRKHLDQVKGGGLLRRLAPARVIGLILSDVPGNDIATIASGPTAPDESTFLEALQVIQRYHLTDIIPESVRSTLERGARGELSETLKPGDANFERVTNLLVGSNEIAAQAALRQAEAEGFRPVLLTSRLEGEARQAGQYLAAVARQCVTTGWPTLPPACLVAGGETTVTLLGNGHGGRNLEVALGSVEELAGMPNVLLITLATDGEDGPTDAAGAVVNGTTKSRAQDLGIQAADYLAINDSYSFFEQIGDLIRCGSTGTNVNDLAFVFILEE